MSIQELQVIACHYLFINKTTANNPQKKIKHMTTVFLGHPFKIL